MFCNTETATQPHVYATVKWLNPSYILPTGITPDMEVTLSSISCSPKMWGATDFKGRNGTDWEP